MGGPLFQNEYMGSVQTDPLKAHCIGSENTKGFRITPSNLSETISLYFIFNKWIFCISSQNAGIN